MQTDHQHVAISLSGLSAVGDWIQLAANWLYSSLRSRLPSTDVIWELNLHPAAAIYKFVFQICEVLSTLWIQVWISVYADGNKLAIFTHLSQLIAWLSQTGCM